MRKLFGQIFLLLAVAMLLAVSVLLAACGETATPTANSTKPATTTTISTTTSVAASTNTTNTTTTATSTTNAVTTTAASTTSTANSQNGACGSINIGGPRSVILNPADAKKAESCFAQAFQKCQSASLVLTVAGVDNGVIHHLSLDNSSGQCQVKDSAQTYISPSKFDAPQQYVCTALSQTSDGLSITGCKGEDDITIPAAQP